MRNFVSVVFDTSAKAYDGLHEFWSLDREGDVTVHGTAVVHRDSVGRLVVDTDQTDPPLATAVGAGIGALVGALAGPAGAAIGAGGGAPSAPPQAPLPGLWRISNAPTSKTRPGLKQASFCSPGSAVIADVSEDWTTPINERMKRLGGTVYRRYARRYSRRNRGPALTTHTTITCIHTSTGRENMPFHSAKATGGGAPL